VFSERFSALQQNPAPLSLFERMNFPQKAVDKLAERGKAAVAQLWPNLSLSDYLDFSRTGRRVPFEEKYFSRRHILNDLVMAEYAENSGEHIDVIADMVWAICEESGWQLPAHNNYVRDASQNALPNVQRPVLDLFACETAAQIALIYHLLGEKLENTAPGICTRTQQELDFRIITPYLNQHFWWMGRGDEKMLNWTPWCTQNVLIAAAVIPMADETRRAICAKAAYSLDCFTKDYGDDGCCDEGAKYYGHAALCMFVAIELLDKMTNGFFTPLYENNKIKNMADFIRQMFVAGDYYINFADCPPILPPPGALEFLFGKRTSNVSLAAFAADGLRRRGLDTPSEDLSLYTRLITLFTISEVSDFKNKGEMPKNTYFASTGIFVARDDKTCLAVKAGNNNDNHNHNDVGSFTLYFNGKPFIIDVGVGSYTRDTFSANRYNIWTMQSAYHNLPTFGGIMQKAGALSSANDVETSIGANEAKIVMDIAGAYPRGTVDKYTREVFLKKGDGVLIVDEYEGENAAVLSLMMCESPDVCGNCVRTFIGQIDILGADNIEVETIEITDTKLKKVWPNTLFRVLISFEQRLELKMMPS